MKLNNKFSFIHTNKFHKILWISIFSFYVLYLLFYILFASKSLLNSDSAFIVDYALESIKYKTLFPKTWVNTNDFWIYSLIPLIIPFIKMGLSLFLSRQIVVVIQTILMFLIIKDLYCNCLNDKKNYLYLLILLFSGISGQVMFEMFGDATYGSIVFYMILELWLFINYFKSEKKLFLLFFTIILTLITACSLRFPIYLAMPLIFVILYLFYNDGIKKKYIKLLLMIIISTFIGLLLNKYLSNTLLISSGTKNPLVNNMDELKNAFFNVIYNYFWLCGATNTNVYSLTIYYNNDFIYSSSPFVLFTFIRVIYALFTISLPFMLFSKIKKISNEERMILIFVSSLSLLILFFLLFCGMNYWYRYITPVLVLLNFLYPIVYKYYFSKFINKKVVFNLLISVFALSSMFFVFASVFDFDKKEFRKNYYSELSDILLENNLYYGFTVNGNEHNIFSTITNGKLKVTRITDDGKSPLLWLNSTDWFNDNYYDGKVFFFRKKTQNSIEDIESKAIDVIDYNDYYIFILENMNIIVDRFE